jgi:hypothetical protein
MSKVQEFLEKLAAGEQGEQEGVSEATLYKLANQDETIEASTTLAVAAEYLNKVAQESGDELIAECAEGLGVASQNLMTGLNKIAADNAAGAIVDMVDTQDGLSKIASVLEAVAIESQNEDFTKLAEDVIEVNNTLFDELAELAQNDESVAQYLAEYHA